MYAWIIEDKLAQAPLPPMSMVRRLAGVFTGIVVLPMPYELPTLYIDYLVETGLEVLYIPTPDHYPVELLDLLRASAFIDKHLAKGGAVLVHCYGGIGRSGLVTSSYLVYRGYSVYEALSHVRNRVPGSVENQWQLQLLEDYYTLLGTLNYSLVKKFADAIEELSELDKVSYKHLSKVIQFTIELYSGLELSDVDLEKEVHASLLHAHRDWVIRLLREKTGLSVKGNGGLAEFSHLLDYKMDSRVVVLYSRTLEKPEIELLCNEPCEDVVNVVKRNLALAKFTELFKVEPSLSWGLYLNYV